MRRNGLLNRITRIKADFGRGLTRIFICVICIFHLCNPCFSENKGLSVGEKLIFNLYWQFIKVGYGTLEVKDVADFNNRKAYHIFSEAKSAPFFDVFFKVRDRNESWIDAEKLYSLAFEQRISEGRFKRDRRTDYDQVKHTAINNKGESFSVPENVLDVLAALYWVRLQELAPKNTLTLNVNSNKKNYKMSVRVREKETVKIGGKNYATIIVEPDLQEAGIFKHKGKVLVWLTDDDKRTPVKMKTEIAVGSIVGELDTEGKDAGY